MKTQTKMLGKQDIIIVLLGEGFDLKDACAQADVSLSAVSYWRKNDCAFSKAIKRSLRNNRAEKKKETMRRQRQKKKEEKKSKVKPYRAAKKIPVYGQRYTCWRCGHDFTCRTYGKETKCPICQSKFWYLPGSHPDQASACVRKQYQGAAKKRTS